MLRLPSIVALLLALPLALAAQTPAPDAAALLALIDGAVEHRQQRLAYYTVVEHYAVFHGSEQTAPIAQMTVRTTYSREQGKSYQILSESGSQLVLRFGLHPLLENERQINLPRNRAQSWFNTNNYKMQPGAATEMLAGRACRVVVIAPRSPAPNRIRGRLWADASDGSVVRIEGTGTKSPSLLSGPARLLREYANLEGVSMATRARAESDHALFGRIVVTIDYSDYQLKIEPAP